MKKIILYGTAVILASFSFVGSTFAAFATRATALNNVFSTAEVFTTPTLTPTTTPIPTASITQTPSNTQNPCGNISIDNNGAGTVNTVNCTNTNVTVIQQNSSTSVNNSVITNTTTGGNINSNH